MEYAVNRAWVYRIVIVWAVFFSLVALGTSIVAVLQNVKWIEMSAQSKFITCVLIFVNWGTAMMAFLSTAANRMEHGRLPINGNSPPGPLKSGDTEQYKKTETKGEK